MMLTYKVQVALILCFSFRNVFLSVCMKILEDTEEIYRIVDSQSFDENEVYEIIDLTENNQDDSSDIWIGQQQQNILAHTVTRFVHKTLQRFCEFVHPLLNSTFIVIIFCFNIQYFFNIYIYF
ncbi:Hypothetical_protein [Hexamita inflata]|uniref:Hypothetical_protein n=1 Tax=Hexamita inflata TaxID=28002 RepID=A0AA86UFB4_9EUKA|nr:Hypothetical protein HINF_LOCUS36602 [Hexamita inflata]